MTVYLAKMTDCTDGFERLYTPPHSGLSNMTLPYMPIKAGKNDNAIKKLQYYSLIMPQIAGELYKGESENLWSYDPVNLYKRRMINYVRRYAEDVYNEIFEITIS